MPQGGPIATLFAATFPERVRKVALSAPVGYLKVSLRPSKQTRIGELTQSLISPLTFVRLAGNNEVAERLDKSGQKTLGSIVCHSWIVLARSTSE